MNRHEFRDTFGPWAVVTGASSGIGEEFARQLAAKGLNLVLVARRESTLHEIAQDLEKKHNVQVRPVPLDLSKADFLPCLRGVTDDLDVGLVISNAGDFPVGELLSTPLEDARAMFRLNASAHLDIAHHFGSHFRNTRSSGGLLFVSSMTALQPTPMLANYSGAKAYVYNLGQALHYELKETGIRSMVLVPGATDTPALKNIVGGMTDGGSIPALPPSRVVSEALDGLVENKPYVVPGLMNKVLDGFGRKIMTRSMGTRMISRVMKRMASNKSES